MNNTQVVINFIYFTYNHRDIIGMIERAFGGNLADHFKSKLKSGSPQHILEFILDMSSDNQDIFVAQIEKEYNYKK